METTKRYFYGKDDKLKSRKLIEKLFKEGKSFSSFPFKAIWLTENPFATLQAGVGVSSRNFKKATDRNRVKRLMREAYRLQKGGLSKALEVKNKRLSLFIMYTGRELPDYNTASEKISGILKKLIKLIDEND
ncbi:MAG: ribonuclease P protein component [Ferruginibacter sp.]